MPTDATDLQANARLLRDLHHNGMLVLPNVWDAASAAVVVEAGFPVVATASAAITAMLGYPDEEKAPWAEMFAAAGRVVGAVSVPVTVDAEAGYGLSPRALVDGLLDIGAVGCNLEDTDYRNGALVEAGRHAEWLSAVRAAADSAGVSLVINARVDTFLPVGAVPEQDRVTETIRRAMLYRDAGADCVYPIGIRAAADIAAIVTALECPVNANTGPGLDLAQLRDLGVKRVSFGPRFYRAALAGLDVSVRGLLSQTSAT